MRPHRPRSPRGLTKAQLIEEAERSRRELAEALEQQTATAEILGIISGSPADAQPVFDAIAVNALRLCDAKGAVVVRYDGELLHVVAHHNVNPEAVDRLKRQYPVAPDRHLPMGRAVLDGVVVQVADLQTAVEFSGTVARQFGARGHVAIPLLHRGRAIGAIGISRPTLGPFSDRQIALLQTFADQAVIAIENVRLFNETKEALEQQTATSEILGVIASSPTAIGPVLDAIAASATTVCGAYDALVLLREGDQTRRAAHHGPLKLAAPEIMPISRTLMTASVILDRRVVHVVDAQTDTQFPGLREIARAVGTRTTLGVPLLREGEAIGALVIRRQEIQPFTAKQVALLETFAAQAVIAIENVRLFTELQEKNGALTEALEQQTATSEILRVISSSATDVQPVFDAITESAARLCGVADGWIVLSEGDTLRGVSAVGQLVGQLPVYNARRVPLTRESVIGRAILNRTTIHIDDLAAASEAEYPEGRALQRLLGHRTQLVTPLLREGVAIGAILLARFEVRLFSERQIELLKTFADQAVIAIENVRLFTELQQKNQALTQAHAQVSESLEQQTATSEILRVISASPTDVRPVMDAIAENAAQLCGEGDASRATSTVWQLEGSSMRIVASYGVPRPTSQAPPGWLSIDALPLNRGFISGRAVVDRQIVHLCDLAEEGDDFAEVKAAQLPQGTRTMLGVPLLREGNALGAIVIRRFEVRPFTDKQIALVKTFADQAVIAIENARLFTELQASNRELTTALDTQTATSGILRVISRSQTDVQPVFDAIVVSAVRLLGAYSGVLARIVGDQIELAALTSTDDAGDAALRARYPLSLQSEELPAQAIRDRAPINIVDAHTDPRWSEAKHAEARIRGYRSQVVVPMLHHDEAIGVIGVSRREPGGFTDAEIALLKTFADQAVIAIQNVRLFTELQERTAALTRSVGQLTALGEVGQAVSSSLELSTVLTTIVGRAVQLCGAGGGAIYEYDEGVEEFHLRAIEGLSEEYLELARQTPQRKGEGATGRLALTPESIEVPDITSPGAYEGRLKDILVRTGYRGLLAVPLLREGHVLGSLVVLRTTPGSFGPDVVSLLQTFATQSALALQNARLFREIELKSREVAAASQHKSEFLANMSHELRTPLNAIIGYSEMLQEEAQDRHQDAFIPDLERINAAAKHQLELINDILDLSKVEAGKMELELTDFHLPTAIDNALTLVRERATRRGIALQAMMDSRLGEVRADERKIKQVVLNLLSNAIRFTPESGRIDVRALPVEGGVEVSVSDTGVGIAPEDQDAVFEEFRQVGTSSGKQEGTGLGLTLCRKFVELHGGRIWVKSQTGVGSTFTFTVPV